MSESHPIEGIPIPAEVSEAIFGARNVIVNGFRAGEHDAATAYRMLTRLYWENPDAPDEARFWMLDEGTELCLEANLDLDVSGDIWEEESNRAER